MQADKTAHLKNLKALLGIFRSQSEKAPHPQNISTHDFPSITMTTKQKGATA